MANYGKRDARKARALDMAASRKPPPDTHLRCHCGELAVIAFTSENGESQFFCEAHQGEAEALMKGR
jgi:hypothetical protein